MRKVLLAGLLLLAGCDNPVEPGEVRTISWKGVYPTEGGHVWYFDARKDGGVVRCIVSEPIWDRHHGGDEYRCEWA